ncbi:ACT domain-containing protein ACR3 [Raphanus sativus]|nr:ACT domain-containing protein ACR3 [Raphanus sativus]
MAKVYWPYFDPEYENLSSRINPPSVSIDNTSCKECTLVKVDSMNKPGILLEVVQVLTDLDLIITKAYISSDGGWFMDVFHVTDQQGNKITDSKTIDYIEKVLGPKGHATSSQNTWPGKRVGVHSLGDHTSIEIIARDRPGLLSEISAVLADLHFNVAAAEAWTHNRRIACVLYVNDNETSRAVDDPERLSAMEEQLNLVIRGCEQEDEKVARTSLSIGSTHVDRRLHQMLFADRDYEAVTTKVDACPGLDPKITVEHCEEKGYSVISVSCEDRAKLMFDIVCTLTDMQYIVFHATISSNGPHASQEYFIRHKDGCTLDSEGEKERVIKCLEAAIHRRVSELGKLTHKHTHLLLVFLALEVFLKLLSETRFGEFLKLLSETQFSESYVQRTELTLSEVTRILREHGLSVTRAGVTTVGEQAVNVFYVRDASGNPVDVKTIDALRGEIDTV